MSADSRDELPDDLPPDEALAAEFVLGVLPARERREAERRMARDAGFAELVRAWEERLAPLADAYGEEPPPAGAFVRIEGQLFGEAALKPARLWDNVSFWRPFGIVTAAGLLLALALNLLAPAPPQVAGPAFVAALSGEGRRVRYVATIAPDWSLRVRFADDDPSPGRSREAWLIAGDAAPVSLGVVRADGAPLTIAEALRAAIREGATIAISDEPQGGSPTGAPTGAVLGAGVLSAI
jgi:anti-sigma-K factor RskA